MILLVLLVGAYLELDDRMDGDIRDHVRGVAQQPGQSLGSVIARHGAEMPNTSMNHLPRANIVHQVRPLGRPGIANRQVGIIRTYGA